ncbi:PilT domain-containing protein [Calothrix sp. NIES-4071]|nr:PilT domain-containing protein [Calothrix sp. NIES-4071]BAZ62923.1 PilT domain-containing protein [Calothrix sp. NIES-4105]
MGMSYLIDTHIFLWWLFDDPKLRTDSREIIANPDNYIIVAVFPLG